MISVTKVFRIQRPMPQKPLTLINCAALKANVFSTTTHFHPGLMFESKAGAYHYKAPLLRCHKVLQENID
jgi:hypothetical protein